jgi:hypothetical protein
MKRIAPLLLVAVAGTAQAGFENMLNPLAMLAPQPSFNPFAGYGGYGGGFGGGYGGGFNPMANPLLSLGGLAALGAIGGPALQLAPGLLTGGYLNPFTNPYMGGPFAGNPLFQQNTPMPFLMPGYPTQGYATQGYPQHGYGAQLFTPSQPSMPSLPFAAQQQGGMPNFFQLPQSAPYPQAMPYQPGNPYQQPGYPNQAPQAQPSGQPFFMAFPAPAPQPAQGPSASFFPPMPQADAQPNAQQPNMQQPNMQQPNAQPPLAFPFLPFAQPPAASPVPAKPVTEAVPVAPALGNAQSPAALMQMFFKPAEPIK